MFIAFPISSLPSSLRGNFDTMRKLLGDKKAELVCVWTPLSSADLCEVTENGIDGGNDGQGREENTHTGT